MWLPAVRLERVTAREEVPAVVIEGDFQRMLLLGVERRLKPPQVLSIVLRQSRHLISQIEPRPQLACVAASGAL